MKIKCNSNDFIKVINQASKIAVKSNINPIFECVLLKVEDHNLIVKTTNLEIMYEKSISVISEVNGEVYIRADILNRLVSNLQKNTSMEIEKINNTLCIKNDKEDVEIDIFSTEDIFPSIPIKNEEILNIKIKDVLNAIKEVSFSSSKSEIKPEIASVYIYNKEDFIYFVSTDSYRLAEKRIDNNFKVIKDFNLIIPIKNIQNIIQILGEENEEEEININNYNDGIIFENNNIFLSSRIINGNFPDYKQLFTKNYNLIVEIDKLELIKALNLNSLITTQYNFTKLSFEIDKLKLNITAEEKSRGNVKSVLDIKVKSESDENLDNKNNIIKITNYNTGYFLEGLSKIESNKILMSFTTENKPVFISNNNNLSFTYLLMPLNR